MTLVSVSSLWGQTQTVSIDDLKRKVEDLRGTKETVVDQAKRVDACKKHITDDNIIPAVDSLFISLDVTIQLLGRIEDSQLEDKEKESLNTEGSTCVIRACAEYFGAIRKKSSSNDIGIGSPKFIDAARTYTDSLNQFNKAAEEKLSSLQNPIGDSLDTDDGIGVEKGSSVLDNVWFWIAIAAILLSVISLIMAIVAWKRVKETEEKIDELTSRILPNIKKKLADLGMKLPQKPTPAAPSGTIHVPATKPNPSVNQKPMMPANPTTSANVEIRYAEVNAASGQPTFYKVSREKSKSKIYRIESDGNGKGEFTIVDDMDADRMEQIIRNHTVYLPPTFCEIKSHAANPTQINVIQKGEAVQEGNSWQVKNRMVIALV